MKPTKALVAISLCVGMAFSAFASTAHYTCNQVKQHCMNNKWSTATCAKRTEQCHRDMARRHEHRVQTGQAQQNNPSTAQQTMQQPIQQASAAATQQSH